MPEAETMVRYTTLGIYMAPLGFSIPFFLWLISPLVPFLAALNINLAVWYTTAALVYLGAMWVVEIGWSSLDVVLNKGGTTRNITFGAIVFTIMAIVTFAFAILVFTGGYTFGNPAYNAIIVGLVVLGMGLYIWQARSVLKPDGERSNHVFAIGMSG